MTNKSWQWSSDPHRGKEFVKEELLKIWHRRPYHKGIWESKREGEDIYKEEYDDFEATCKLQHAPYEAMTKGEGIVLNIFLATGHELGKGKAEEMKKGECKNPKVGLDDAHDGHLQSFVS